MTHRTLTKIAFTAIMATPGLATASEYTFFLEGQTGNATIANDSATMYGAAVGYQDESEALYIEHQQTSETDDLNLSYSVTSAIFQLGLIGPDALRAYATFGGGHLSSDDAALSGEEGFGVTVGTGVRANVYDNIFVTAEYREPVGFDRTVQGSLRWAF